MPTDIYFAADKVALRVDEAPSQVAQAFTDAQGLPFRLTGQGSRGEVYVNPGAVAFWLASGASPPPAAQDPPDLATRRQAVTDIWGRPLRRKARD